jgi:hypothetical protein
LGDDNRIRARSVEERAAKLVSHTRGRLFCYGVVLRVGVGEYAYPLGFRVRTAVATGRHGNGLFRVRTVRLGSLLKGCDADVGGKDPDRIIRFRVVDVLWLGVLDLMSSVARILDTVSRPRVNMQVRVGERDEMNVEVETRIGKRSR